MTIAENREQDCWFLISNSQRKNHQYCIHLGINCLQRKAMPFFPSVQLHFLGHEFLLPPVDQHYDIQEHALAIMSNVTGDDSYVFCDMISFYISLKRQNPFSTIEISEICCWYKMYIHAFRIGYTIRSSDGNVRRINSPLETLNKRGMTISPQETQELDLEEYIIDAHQEGMMERLVFTTNKRVIAFGINASAAGHTLEDYREPDGGRKVVALGGACINGRKLKVAYMTESVNWSIIGNLILVRRLVEDQRANIMPTGEASSQDLQSLAVYIFQESNEEIFHAILSYLAFDISP